MAITLYRLNLLFINILLILQRKPEKGKPDSVVCHCLKLPVLFITGMTDLLVQEAETKKEESGEKKEDSGEEKDKVEENEVDENGEEAKDEEMVRTNMRQLKHLSWSGSLDY